MPDGLKVDFHQELKDYEKEIAKGNLQAARNIWNGRIFLVSHGHASILMFIGLC